MNDRSIDQTLNLDRQLMDERHFDSLLKWLEPDREAAGLVYEQVRNKLIRLFEFQGCAFPEELADDAVQRASRKISEGAVVRPTDPFTYFRGVARNVLLEYWKDKKRHSTTTFEEMSPSSHPSVNPIELERQSLKRNEKERMLECLEYCLNNLPSESRDLFLEYNKEEKRDRIDNRTIMAKNLGIDITTLRNRITRIREKLQKCVSTCARR